MTQLHPLPVESQSDMFSVAGRYGVAGNGAARRYFDIAQPDGCVAEVTTVNEHVHDLVLSILNGGAPKRASRAAPPRYAVIGSGCAGRIYPVRNINETTLQLVGSVGGQEFFDALVSAIIQGLDPGLADRDIATEAYTKELWLVGITPADGQTPHQARVVPCLTRSNGATIATFGEATFGSRAAGEPEANARRAAVCVNKLQGISTAALEKLPDGLLLNLIENHFANSPL